MGKKTEIERDYNDDFIGATNKIGIASATLKAITCEFDDDMGTMLTDAAYGARAALFEAREHVKALFDAIENGGKREVGHE